MICNLVILFLMFIAIAGCQKKRHQVEEKTIPPHYIKELKAQNDPQNK